MKASVLALVAAGSLVAAQVPGLDLPPCATDCLLSSLSAAEDCTPGDIPCSCKPENQAKIKEASQSCLADACSKEDAEKAVQAGEALCKSVGGGGGDASGSGSGMPSMTSGMASAPGTVDSTPAMSMPTHSGSMSHSMSSGMHNGTSMTHATGTNGGSMTTGGSGATGSNGASGTPTPTEGAATAPAAGIVAALMAAVFAL